MLHRSLCFLALASSVAGFMPSANNLLPKANALRKFCTLKLMCFR
jgi:hypothetical protein